MKYIIDVDLLKDCLDLIYKPVTYSGNPCVYLNDVKEMIDKFPKDKYDTGHKEQLNATTETSISVNNDILNGKGLKPLR